MNFAQTTLAQKSLAILDLASHIWIRPKLCIPIMVYKSSFKKCTKPWVKGQVESGFWPCLAFMAFENKKNVGGKFYA